MSYGPEGEAFFCDVCEDNPKRCDHKSCPGLDDPDEQRCAECDVPMTLEENRAGMLFCANCRWFDR